MQEFGRARKLRNCREEEDLKVEMAWRIRTGLIFTTME